jgi:hypothetical protein
MKTPKLELKETNHPYYCSESNFYSNEASMRFETMSDFLDSFEEADIDMNLCFRWDIKPHWDNEGDGVSEGYRAEVFIMIQRKGIFKPITIDRITEEDLPRFEKYLLKHWEVMKKIWNPLT